MPKSEIQVERKSIRLPKNLIEEADRVVQKSRLYLNRQQFIESAIREKIEKTDSFSGKINTGLDSSFIDLFQSQDNNLLIGVRESFFMHTIIALVKGKSLPNDHMNPAFIEEKIKSYIKQKAEIEKKQLTKKQFTDLTNSLLEYHNGIIQGLGILESDLI
jgi:Arc/MetJ-type ribon-helix-helix transcriptional regulator